MQALLTITTAVLVLAGCATASQTPTHRWASTEQADKIKYHQDHARCQVSANLQTDAAELDPTSPQFSAYKQCMNNRGYVLTAYNNK